MRDKAEIYQKKCRVELNSGIIVLGAAVKYLFWMSGGRGLDVYVVCFLFLFFFPSASRVVVCFLI